MPKAKRDTALYRRGDYWLDWDARADGTRRTPFLTVYWYDPDRRRTRSVSTGTADVEEGKRWLDAFYLGKTTGKTVCHACGRPYDDVSGHLVTTAIDTYQTLHADALTSSGAVRSRLSHVLDYLDAIGQHAVTCEQVDEAWIGKFRTWSAKQPIVSPTGKKRPRSLSTTEGSVAQLSAAINDAHHRRKNTRHPAGFKSLPAKGLNRSPQHRSDVAELAEMFRYCVSPEARTEEERKRRIRERASLHRFLIAGVATLARPDAIYDISTTPARRQWNSKARVLALNPKGRRQTKKYRATVPIAWQVALHLDQAKGYFVGVKNVRTAWENMAREIGLPDEGEAGTKLIRRSMAKMLRDRLPKADWSEIVMFLGHAQFDETSDIYAPFDPNYLGAARAEIERVIDEIERLSPGAFHRTCTGDGATIVPLVGRKK